MIDSDGGGGLSQYNSRNLCLSEVDLEGSYQAGLSEEVGSIVHAIKLEVFLDDLTILITFLVLLDLDAELEAQVVQPLELEALAH